MSEVWSCDASRQECAHAVRCGETYDICKVMSVWVWVCMGVRSFRACDTCREVGERIPLPDT